MSTPAALRASAHALPAEAHRADTKGSSGLFWVMGNKGSPLLIVHDKFQIRIDLLYNKSYNVDIANVILEADREGPYS